MFPGDVDVDADAVGLETKNHFPGRKTMNKILPEELACYWLHSVAQIFSAWWSP